MFLDVTCMWLGWWRCFFFPGLVMFLSCESPSSNRANYKYIYIYAHTYYIYIIHRPSFTSKRRCLSQHVPVFANVWTTLRVRYMCFVCYQIKHCKRWIYVCLCCIMYYVCCLIYNIVPAFSNIQMLLPLRNRWILCATLPLSCTLLWCANIQKRSVGRRTWGIETGALQPTQIFRA